MIVAITGSNSGIGLAVASCLTKTSTDNHVIGLTRSDLDLSDTDAVLNYAMPSVDVFVNCAATGHGGKISFEQHNPSYVAEILNTNLIAPVLLSQKALVTNPSCRIVNITSTNNNQYWPGDLAYSLSKLSLSDFGRMLRVDCPTADVLEVRLGLTKTNFNQNRYRNCEDRFEELYNRPHLTAESAAERICSVLFDSTVKFLEIVP